LLVIGTKFHIYKVENGHEIEELVGFIEEKFEDEDIQFNDINQNNFRGFLFFNVSTPVWSEVISDLIGEQHQENIWNRHSSYILFKSSGENIYVIVGGNGYRYIQDIIEKDFGLNLVPKLVHGGDNVIKKGC